MLSDRRERDRWFAENLQPHESMLKAWLHSRFSDNLDIDDIVQEAYMRVFEACAKREVNAPRAFLFATARNVALNALRAARVRGDQSSVHFEGDEIMDEALGVHETAVRNQELEMLTAAIQALPDRCRQVFTLRKVYGLPQREIAKRLGISARTVNAQITIGINKCAEFLGGYCEEGK